MKSAMPDQEQLEIIHPDGAVEFVPLDPTRGAINIGRHPDNDVVLESPSVAPFHAVLNCGQKPYHLLLLSLEGGETTLGSRPLSPDAPTEYHAWDAVEVAGYIIILIGDVTAGASAAPEEHPAKSSRETRAARPAGWWKGLSRNIPGLKKIKPKLPRVKTPKVGRGRMPAGKFGGPAAAQRPGEEQAAQEQSRQAAPPPDQHDEVIVAELAEREWTIGVEETATCQLTIANGGNIVATFEVRVEGVDESWVVISPSHVNLNEGERETVAISITPPRAPSSRAGSHPLSVIVTSPNHPGHSSQCGAVLTVNPYYEFSVGELSPKQQNISWRQHTGRATLPVTNKGNSAALFRIEAEDDERACSFEIQSPEEEAGFARRAEMRLSPGRTFNVPIQITPHSRQLWGMSQRFYSYAVTTSMPEGDQSPRALMGRMSSKPLIGPWLTALILLLLAATIVLVFRPWIKDFSVEPEIVQAGKSVRLSWSVSPFATDLEIAGLGPVEGSTGTETDSPTASTTYLLKANTWLSRLIPLLSRPDPETVIVMPRMPGIESFSVDDKDITKGESVTLYWSVGDADKVILTANEVSEVIPPEEYIGQRIVAPAKNTVYALEAQSGSGLTLKSLMVRVVPLILDVRVFDVQPAQITAGESVTITWSVLGAESVTISPLSSVYPPDGSTTHAPEQTMDFVLTASNAESEVRLVRHLVVNPAPEPPTIEFFTAAPTEVVAGSNSAVQLTWSVVGATTNVEITSADSETLSGLEVQGVTTVEVDKSTSFILTAHNGELHTSQVVEVTAVEPTPEGE